MWSCRKTPYLVRFSIPTCSPRRSTIEGGTEGGGDVDGPQNTNSSEASSNAKSTVESLLDKHIQCLSLQPELAVVDPSGKICQEQKCEPLTASRIDSTVKVSDHDKQLWYEGAHHRSGSSAYPSTLPNAEREFLVPKKLFNKFYRTALPSTPTLTSAQSLPYMSEGASPERTAKRSFPGWHTLGFTIQLLSSPLAFPGMGTNLGNGQFCPAAVWLALCSVTCLDQCPVPGAGYCCSITPYLSLSRLLRFKRWLFRDDALRA